jgi:exodeoxyribonuclease VIII
MTNQEYHSKTDFLSKSLLDQLHKSPAHFQAYIQGEKKEPTASMVFGSLVHSVLFDQDDFAIMPSCDRRTKEGKMLYEAFLETSEGKELIVTSEQHEQALLIAQSVAKHPKASALLSEGVAEIPVFGQLGGMPAKCKPDFHNTKFNVLVDLKTTNDASPTEFAKSVWNFRYHVQAAMYMDLTNAKRFFFIAVEKEAPFNCEIYELDEESIAIGRAEYLADIETYKKCLKTNNWHGYTEEAAIHVIGLPAWAKK